MCSLTEISVVTLNETFGQFEPDFPKLPMFLHRKLPTRHFVPHHATFTVAASLSVAFLISLAF